MPRPNVFVFGLVAMALTGMTGCGSAMSVGRMGLNLKKKDLHLKVMLDGQVAEQNKLKKAVAGHSGWKIKQQVSTSPVLRFEIEDPEDFGRITSVIINIYQQFEADYSHQAEYAVYATSQDPQAQMKPGVDYDLGNLPPGFEARALGGQTGSRVELRPGMKYKMNLTVVADRSETGQIEFETR